MEKSRNNDYMEKCLAEHIVPSGTTTFDRSYNGNLQEYKLL